VREAKARLERCPPVRLQAPQRTASFRTLRYPLVTRTARRLEWVREQGELPDWWERNPTPRTRLTSVVALPSLLVGRDLLVRTSAAIVVLARWALVLFAAWLLGRTPAAGSERCRGGAGGGNSVCASHGVIPLGACPARVVPTAGFRSCEAEAAAPPRRRESWCRLERVARARSGGRGRGLVATGAYSVPRRVGVRVMEDLERAIAIANVDLETGAGSSIVDRHQ
jgi:hypothetical protein